MLRTIETEPPIGRAVSQGASGEPDDGRAQTALLESLLHEFKAQGGDQDARAECHDTRDPAIRQLDPIADRGPDQQRPAGEQTPKSCLQPDWYHDSSRERVVAFINALCLRGIHLSAVGTICSGCRPQHKNRLPVFGQGAITHAAMRMCCRGSRTMRHVSTTSSGFAGPRVSYVLGAKPRAVGGWATAGFGANHADAECL